MILPPRQHLILVRRMRALLILASLLTACETTWQVHQGPNQAPELSATRREDFLLMTSTLKIEAQLALAWISSKTPASLVRFASSRSRTPAVLLCNGSGRSALSR